MRDYIKDKDRMDLIPLLPLIKGNCGICFTNYKGNMIDIHNIRKKMISRQTISPAKEGMIAPHDVYLKQGPTGLDPMRCDGFAPLNIPTRIYRGQINIMCNVHLINKGDKVTASQVKMLEKLQLKPFYYRIKIIAIYVKGKLIDDQMINNFNIGLSNVSALCFKLKYPCIICVPHTVLNCYKKVVALGLNLNNYSWKELEQV